MRPLQKIVRDPAMWALIAFNVILIVQYQNDVREYTTIVWLYWCQSVLIGIFTFFDMITLKKEDLVDEDMTINGRPAKAADAKGCMSWFFVIHYGGFHLGYLIFLFIDFHFTDINFISLKWSLLALFITYTFFFIQNKTKYRHVKRKLTFMFLMPYMRIVPMHLTILLPKFFHWQPALTFLVLKMLMDVVGHLVATPYYWKDEDLEEVEHNVHQEAP